MVVEPLLLIQTAYRAIQINILQYHIVPSEIKIIRNNIIFNRAWLSTRRSRLTSKLETLLTYTRQTLRSSTRARLELIFYVPKTNIIFRRLRECKTILRFSSPIVTTIIININAKLL